MKFNIPRERRFSRNFHCSRRLCPPCEQDVTLLWNRAIIYAYAKNIHFWSFLAKKHGLSPMLLIDFASFSHLLNYVLLFLLVQKTYILGNFCSKSMDYSPWVWSILSHFHTLYIFLFFWTLACCFLWLLNITLWGDLNLHKPYGSRGLLAIWNY
jgi:hypothetical protein